MNGLPDGLPATLIARAGQPADLPSALRELRIRPGRPVLVAVGGAGGMSTTPDRLAPLARVTEDVVRALRRLDGAIVDGGTDAGVMKVMGQARQSAGAGVPLVGVAAEETVAVPGQPAAAGAAPLEPHHTHVLLVPGREWGDESPWLSRVAAAIAGGSPSVTLVVNGGQITYDDIELSLRAGRPVIVVAGTGRTADDIAAAARGAAPNPRAARLAAAPGTRVMPLSDPQAICAAIEAILAPGGGPVTGAVPDRAG